MKRMLRLNDSGCYRRVDLVLQLHVVVLHALGAVVDYETDTGLAANGAWSLDCTTIGL